MSYEKEKYYKWIKSINPLAKIEKQYCLYTNFALYIKELEQDKKELLEFIILIIKTKQVDYKLKNYAKILLKKMQK